MIIFIPLKRHKRKFVTRGDAMINPVEFGLRANRVLSELSRFFVPRPLSNGAKLALGGTGALFVRGWLEVILDKRGPDVEFFIRNIHQNSGPFEISSDGDDLLLLSMPTEVPISLLLIEPCRAHFSVPFCLANIVLEVELQSHVFERRFSRDNENESAVDVEELMDVMLLFDRDRVAFDAISRLYPDQSKNLLRKLEKPDVLVALNALRTIVPMDEELRLLRDAVVRSGAANQGLSLAE
jgi:hypothetical protein